MLLHFLLVNVMRFRKVCLSRMMMMSAANPAKTFFLHSSINASGIYLESQLALASARPATRLASTSELGLALVSSRRSSPPNPCYGSRSQSLAWLWSRSHEPCVDLSDSSKKGLNPSSGCASKSGFAVNCSSSAAAIPGPPVKKKKQKLAGIEVMASAARATLCIGDLHGYSMRLRSLWRNLELRLGAAAFSSATVIFLGDYCDRGPDTAGVLDFLISLPTRYPSQNHVFLCGNHDFGFSAFLGLLAAPARFRFSETWSAARKGAEEEEGWWSGLGQEEIHLQGRRWGGRMKTKWNAKKGMEYKGSIYDAEPTFNSYGVEHGDREGLIKAVPDTHKAFLQSLLWIHEQEGLEVADDPANSYSKLVAVHAGLEQTKPLKEQIAMLKNKDVTAARLEPFCGRNNVWNTPKELVKDRVLVVSGHHGALHTERFRLIIDESGGMEHLPLSAIVLPSRTIVRDTDVLPDTSSATYLYPIATPT